MLANLANVTNIIEKLTVGNFSILYSKRSATLVFLNQLFAKILLMLPRSYQVTLLCKTKNGIYLTSSKQKQNKEGAALFFAWMYLLLPIFYITNISCTTLVDILVDYIY